MPKAPLSTEVIASKLDVYLEVEFTFIKTQPPAQVLANLDRSQQDFILGWVKSVASTNTQMAYQFINQAIEATDILDRRIIEAWALRAMDSYDQFGLHAALKIIRDVKQFIHDDHQRTTGSVFADNAGVLRHFAHGLSGRQLKLDEADEAHTDTETIFLPPILACLATPEDNFLVYKIMVAYLWAQTRFGTFHIDLINELNKQSNPEKFLTLFHTLETFRLEACIQRELPGLYRDIQHIKQQLNEDTLAGPWQTLANELHKPGKSVHDVLRLALELQNKLPPINPFCYQGIIDPEKVALCMSKRLEKEKAALRTALFKMSEELSAEQNQAQDSQPKFGAKKVPNPSHPDGFHMEITLDDIPVAVPENVKGLITSIQLDLGEIPDEYLQPAGPGDYNSKLLEKQAANPDDVWKGTYHEEGAFLYHEWDYRRSNYRKNWCAVREKAIAPVYDNFVRDTLHKYAGLVKHLRKIFEAMRDEDRLLKRQSDGDGVDIDALVEALADSRDGSEMTDRLFTRMHRTERNIAVVFMVDMSGSTKGWINDAERESLVLLAEALETLGDRYAIYGFSGLARKRCEIFTIKTLDEPYDDEVKARISGIVPQDYTRMGFAIRHLSKILNEADARTRILITLSDGKPDDYDSYRGEYGIEDTRRALLEARRSGIHPYCITIDKEARDYLPHMYGPASYTVIDEAYQLPLKISDIYRRITIR